MFSSMLCFSYFLRTLSHLLYAIAKDISKEYNKGEKQIVLLFHKKLI